VWYGRVTSYGSCGGSIKPSIRIFERGNLTQILNVEIENSVNEAIVVNLGKTEDTNLLLCFYFNSCTTNKILHVSIYKTLHIIEGAFLLRF
jgi:hypothetical protein